MSATLFIGVDVSHLYSTEKVYEPVTRYNELTGEPYTKEVCKGYNETYGNFKINYTKSADDFFSQYGLIVKNVKYIGIEIAELDNLANETITWGNLEEYKADLIENLTPLGWQDLPIILNLDTDFSYCY